MMPMRVLPVNFSTVLVDLAGLDETLALFASLQAAPLDGIVETIPAARTLMIRFRPERISAETLAARIAARDLSARPAACQRTVEIPVRYDGPDLAEVAELTGLSIAEVVRRHSESLFTVAFCGFAPGFGYLVDGDPALHVPRRQSPRTRIPAGSVALAGSFSGVYPSESPGGWQIIGTTPLRMWDIFREPGALLQPGFRVRFVDMDKAQVTVPAATPAPAKPYVAADAPQFKIRAAPIPALFQDAGRSGRSGQGVSASGALDRGAFFAANRIVGNPADTPCLELTGGGFCFETTARAVIGLAGATCPVTIRNAAGRARVFDSWRPVPLEPGDVVTVGPPDAGMRAYLAVRNGYEVAPVLGSAATDTLAKIGPDPVEAGVALALRTETLPLDSVALHEAPAFALPTSGDVVTLDIVLGPRADWFTPAGLAALSGQDWRVTPQSSRVGIRLAGERSIERKDRAELASEGTATGAIQVPHDGQPVLFLADHPLTGGYPVVATVAEYHLDLAGQLPVGAAVRFRPVDPFAEIAIGVPP